MLQAGDTSGQLHQPFVNQHPCSLDDGEEQGRVDPEIDAGDPHGEREDEGRHEAIARVECDRPRR